jgi:Domain of unknown function (DUF4920)
MLRKMIFISLLLVGTTVVEAKNYGAKMPKGEAVNIALVASNVSDYAGKQGKFAGRITQVCQAKGCWVVIESDGKSARISTKDKFFVPKNSKGNAVVYGEVQQVTLSADKAKHYAEDAGKNTPVPNDEIQIIATAIRID